MSFLLRPKSHLRLCTQQHGEALDVAQAVGSLMPSGPSASTENSNRLAFEDRALAGPDHEEDVVVLRVGVLEVIERDQLGVVRTEKDAVVVREGQEANTAAGPDRQE